MNKEKRHLKIKELIEKFEITTQDELVDHLRKAGFPVTQATVSRDIKELQLVKLPLKEGKYIYTLPREQRTTTEDKLQRILLDVFVNVDAASNLVVLKTIPGNAHAVGVVLDSLNWNDVVGTVCGDDTCLIVARSPEQAVKLKKRIMDLIS
jgi:transcriptional regulator, ArgR family